MERHMGIYGWVSMDASRRMSNIKYMRSITPPCDRLSTLKASLCPSKLYLQYWIRWPVLLYISTYTHLTTYLHTIYFICIPSNAISTHTHLTTYLLKSSHRVGWPQTTPYMKVFLLKPSPFGRLPPHTSPARCVWPFVMATFCLRSCAHAKRPKQDMLDR